MGVDIRRLCSDTFLVTLAHTLPTLHNPLTLYTCSFWPCQMQRVNRVNRIIIVFESQHTDADHRSLVVSESTVARAADPVHRKRLASNGHRTVIVLLLQSAIAK